MICVKRSANKGFAKAGLCVAISLAYAHAQSPPAPTQLPQGGKVVGGSAAISSSGNTLTVQQSSQRAAIDWNSFNLGSGAQVNFNQPNAASVTLNRVLDSNPSQIMGRINAPGQVFILNPNGVLFGVSSQVDVGGLLVTTHGISNADFMAGKSTFEGNSKNASITNQGTLQASLGGYIALLAPQVRNEGVIVAREGTIAMAAGNKTTLVFSGQSLTALQIDEGVMDALVENKHLVRADGGLVLMTARSASVLMGSVVRNSGTVQAQTIANKGGRIMLMGDMSSGTTEVNGSLDASAPNGGDGGFIETSAGKVKIADEVRITTLAPQGKTGNWLVDPVDFTVASSGGDISNTTLQNSLVNTSVELQSAAGATAGSGDININADVSWTSNQILTLTASNNVNVNANLSATGNTAGLVINPNTTHTTGSVTQTASGTGVFNLQMGKSITLSGSTPTLSIAGQSYTVINSLGTSTSSGDGTLQGMRGNLSGYYALGSDIDASATSSWNSGAGFSGIAQGSSEFTGKIHGLGHSINNLSITSARTDAIGFIPWLSGTGSISNLGLSGGYVGASTNAINIGSLVGTNYGVISKSYSTANVNSGSSTWSIGGLVGGNSGARGYGLIVDSYATGSVTSGSSTHAAGGLSGDNSGTIQNSFASGNVTVGANSGTNGGAYYGVGGLVGYTQGPITKSYATGNVSTNGRADDFGGLIGYAANTTVTKSYATGSVTTVGGRDIGGFVGNSVGSTISNSYATGSVTAPNATLVGGFIGSNWSGNSVSNSYASGVVTVVGGIAKGFSGNAVGTSSNNYWNTTTSGITSAGFAGETGITSTQMQSMSTFTAAGWDPSIWQIIPGQNSSFPVLSVGASSLYVRLVSGSSTYGVNPTFSYKLFNMSSGGTEVTGFTPSGTPSWSTTLSGTTSVGTYSLSYAGGVSISNSNLVPLTGAGTNWIINPAPLGVSVSKVYDGTSNFNTGFSVSGMVNGDAAPTVAGTASTSSKNAGSYGSFASNSLTLSNPNYSVSVVGSTLNATITPKSLTASVTAIDKTYDGTTTATPTINVTGGLVGAETVTATGTAVFNSKDVFSANTVIVDSATLANGANGGLAANYSLPIGIFTSAAINAKALSASVTAPNKTYDGSTTATPTISITGGLVGTETVTATGTAVFNSKDVLSATTVIVNSATLANGTNGGLATNYSLATGIFTSAGINIKALSATVTANKAYDGTTIATPIVSITAGLVGSETLTASGTATFNAKDVATANTVTLNTLSLANGTNGGLATNYSLAGGFTGAASITTKSLSGSITAPNKTYDGNTTATPTVSITGGFVGTETVTATGTASFNTKNVATANTVTLNTVSLADGTNGGLATNYSLATGVSTSAGINAKALIASITAPNKTYDGNTTAAPTVSITSGLVGTETVTASGTATFNSKDVLAANTVTLNTVSLGNGTNGGFASNYSLATGFTGAASITAKTLSGSITAPNKTYDGNTTATPTVSITGGLVGSEIVRATGTASFNSKDAATATTVTLDTFALADGANGGLASNYTLPTGIFTSAAINTKALSATVTANKTYDGTTTATPYVNITDGLVGTETVTATGTASFNTNDVLTANTVTLNTVALADGANGGLASNYNLTSGFTGPASINAKTLSGSVTAPNKTYDGTTTAAPTVTITGGLEGFETVTATGTATFNSKDVLTANTVTLNTATLTNGAYGGLASNYTLPTGIFTSASINAKALSAMVNANKTYDGNTTATPTVTITDGLVGLEIVTASGTATFNTKDVANANAVTLNSVALADGNSGGLASNYNLASGFTGSAFINAKTLSGSVTTPNKTYDGNTTATPTVSITNGLVGTETVTVTGTATFNSKDVMSSNRVTLNSVALADGSNGGLASNYIFSTGIFTSATINAKTLSATVSANKAYDGTTSATPTINITSGLVGFESVAATGTATFNSKDVLTANSVTLNTVALADGSNGGLASNYNLATGVSGIGLIVGKTLSASVTAPSKTYDGNTTATPTVSITGGLVGSETVTATGTATFNAKDVATANTVTLNTVSLTNGSNGGLAANYTLPTGIFTSAAINARALSASMTVPNKTYDGNTTASPTVSITSGLVGTETVTASGTATFNSKDVMSSNRVALNSVALADGGNGGLASNYILATGIFNSATINAKALSASLTAPNKAYDGTTSATSTINITGGLVNTETLSVTGAASFNSKDVATANTVTLNSFSMTDGANGGLATNYSFPSGIFTSAGINAKALSVNLTADNKTYDGNTSATPTVNITGGLVGSETVTATGTATFNAKDVATANTVTLNTVSLTNGSNGGLAANYTLPTGIFTSAAINAKALSASMTVPNKTYDGNTTATPTVSITSGLVGTETVTASGTATFNSKDVMSSNRVTLNSVALADGDNGGLASNYILPTGIFTSATINPKTLSASVTAPNKVFDGNNTATPAINITGGFVGPETVLVESAAAKFDNKSVGNAKDFSVTNSKLGDGANGGLASNYVLASPITGKADITFPTYVNTPLELTGPQLGILPPAIIAALSAQEIQGLNPDQIRGLTSAQLGALSSRQLSMLTVDQFASMTPEQLNVLTSDALDKATNNTPTPSTTALPVASPASAANTTRTAALANAGLTVIANAQMSQLTPAQLQAITPANFSALNPGQVASLSVQQFQLLSPSQLRSLSTTHIAALSGEQLKSVSNSQLNSLTPTQVSALTLKQIEALSTTQLTTLNEAQVASLTPSQLAALSPTTISKLSESQLQALTGSQMVSLSNAQLSSLDKPQLQCLSCNQFKALTPQQIADLPPAVFKSLLSSKIACIKPQQLAALSESQMKMLSTSQITELTSEQLQALSNNQLSVLTSVQIQRLKTDQLQTLLPTQVATLSSDKLRVALKSLTVEQVQALTPLQISTLSVTDIALLQPLQLQSLSVVQIAVLAPEFVAQLSRAQLRALLPTQVAALRVEQIAALSPQQLQVLLINQLALLTPEQRKAFNNPLLVPQPVTAADISIATTLNSLAPSEVTPDKLTLLTPQQLRLVSDTQIKSWGRTQISTLSLAQLQSLTPEQIAAISPIVLANLDAKFVQNLQPSQVALFTPAQLQALTPAQVQSLSTSVVASLTPEQIKALSAQQTALLLSAQVQALSKAQLQAMSQEQMSNLNPLQLANLSPAQLAVLTPEQISLLKAPQLQSLNQAQINGLWVAQIAALTKAQISALRPEQVLALNQAQVGSLSPAQFAALQVKQLQALQENQIAVLNFAQLDALSPAQLQALTPNQITALTPSLFGLLSKPQVQALTRTQFAVLTPQAIAAMGEVQLAALTNAQMSAINAQQLAALSASQLQAFTAAQLAAINASQLMALSNTQLQSISPEQIGQLNQPQLISVLRLLNPNQLTGLTQTQVASMDINQLRSLSPAQLQTLADRKMITLTSR